MSAGILIIIGIAAIIGWLYLDYRLHAAGKPTVTQIVIKYSRDCPLIPWIIGFFMGLLTGHFYA